MLSFGTVFVKLIKKLINMRSPLLITLLGLFLSFNLNAQSIVVNATSENEFSFELNVSQEKLEFQTLDVRGAEYLNIKSIKCQNLWMLEIPTYPCTVS